QDERLHRAVAIKRLYPQPGVSDELAEVTTGRAMREARITARLQHPHAVTVYDVVEDHGQPCLIMQLVPSEPLSARLTGGQVLPVAEVAQLGADLAAALAAAHRAGIVHRDVKPGNVLLAEDGTARISDFGIAHAMGDVTLTATGLVTGTPAFLAPEVARGEDSGYAADVFSLGATLYTALEGHTPFGGDGNPMALLHRVASGVVEPPQHSGPLAPLLAEMMRSDPQDRPTMAEVADELAQAAGGDPAPAEVDANATRAMPLPVPLDADEEPLPRARPLPTQSPRRRRAAPWLVATALVVVAVLAFVLVRSLGSSAPPVTAPAPAATSSSSSPSSAPTTPPAATTAAPSSATTSAPTTPAPSPSTSAPPPPTTATATATTTATTAATTPAPATPSAEDLKGAVTRYYGLMPGGTDQAWPLLTASYQTTKTGGRAAYQRFWDQFSGVTVTDVTGTPPGTVQATVTYRFKDGRVSRERTTYGLVNDAGVLKIDTSNVTG
ncbi:MAG: serine/threonine-protein kinase, partial [Lapillicoccus sp.]